VNNPSRATILIEGPTWGNAEFYGKWLLAAAEAQASWVEAQKDREFRKQAERLSIAFIPDFGIAASLIIMGLRKYLNTLTLELDSEQGDDFTMMLGMGFFITCEQRYKMIVPADLTEEKVKKAMLAYAMTEDEEHVLHPEYLVTAVPFATAKACQARMRATKDFREDGGCLGWA
jgi:hypothetical protein